MACQVVLAERQLIDPDEAISGHIDLPGTPQATPLARRFVLSMLDGASSGVVADVELLTAELVTNVVLHARTNVHVGLSRDAENILVTVQDYSDKTSAQRAAAPNDQLAESGRGMTIIASIADDFGWKRLPDDVGKVMWFAVSARGQGDEAADPHHATETLVTGDGIYEVVAEHPHEWKVPASEQ